MSKTLGEMAPGRIGLLRRTLPDAQAQPLMSPTWIKPPPDSLTGEFPGGFQCAECGFYFSRNQIKDVNGEYYCRSGMGHNRTQPNGAREETR